MTTDDHIVFIVDDDARMREALGELLESHGIRTIAFGVGRRVCSRRQAGRACLPHPRRRAAGYQRPRSAEADRGRRSSADRFPYGAWRHSLVGAGDQARRGGLSDQAVQGARSDGRNPCGDRAGSGDHGRSARSSSMLRQRYRQPDAARTRGAAAGGQRTSQQAGGGGARDQRGHPPNPSAGT